MSLLSERVTRTQTAITSWLEIDDLMWREDYPDAQMLIERMRLANKRWHPPPGASQSSPNRAVALRELRWDPRSRRKARRGIRLLLGVGGTSLRRVLPR